MIVRFIKSLSEIGIEPEYDVFDKTIIRTANNFFLLSAPVYIFFIVLNIIKFSPLLISIYLFMLSLTGFTLVLNHYKLHKIASAYVIFIFLIQFCFLYVMFGPELGIESLFILLVFASIHLFYRTKLVYWVVLIITLSYLGIKSITPIYFTPSDFTVFAVTPYVFLIMTIVIITQFAISKFRDIVKYADSRNEAVYELQSINQSLIENEKVMLNQKNELEEINEQLERYAFVASHDLKSPIRSIKSFIDLSKIKLKQGDHAKVEEYFSFMSKSATHMGNLVNDLLEFSKLDGQRIAFEETDLNQLLNSAIDLLQAENQVESHDLPYALVNPVQFQLIFQNLIQNGLKYNESPTPKIQIRYWAENEHHFMTFEDNGLGIETQYHDEIFQMFSRLHTAEKYEGTGLGLSICNKIMQQHQGKITLKSSLLGKGSIFELNWPRHLEIQSKN